MDKHTHPGLDLIHAASSDHEADAHPWLKTRHDSAPLSPRELLYVIDEAVLDRWLRGDLCA